MAALPLLKEQMTLFFIVLFACTGVVSSQEVGDPASGHKLAEAECSECHAVEAGEIFSPNVFAPAFQAVADTPGMTGLALSVWSVTPHQTMPNLKFDNTQRADIIAYILSLKSR